ncbi:hypothetical protein H1S01_09215 [Heliobacterium chlorum]|uniref:LppM domain-containing protein n=1 Tax=Heliobacterium chlorum TaxID=2698 RepID=A0ABR7T4A4_HELCL|nr:hypothetical protein [Heliobacterium chlorum]MBC9784689.1 hypothetical protein [Heliobacterium chlorum]
MRGTMKRVFQVFLLLGLCAIFLVGCVQSDVNVKINSDGSGDIRYTVLVNQALLGTGENGNPMDELKQNAEKAGYTVEAVEKDGLVGLNAAKHVANVSAEASDDILLGKFGEGFVKQKSFLKDTYSLNSVIDLSDMSVTANERLAPSFESALKQAKLTLTVELPNAAVKHNATAVDKGGKVLTWDLKPGQPNEISFTTDQYNPIDMSLVSAAALVIAIGLIRLIVSSTGSNASKEAAVSQEEAKKEENGPTQE